MSRIFLLSPAKSNGRRAQLLLRPAAGFDLAQKVRCGAATLGEVFSFCSGLYFRGKLAYATRFAQPPKGSPGVLIITPSRGLAPPEMPVGEEEFREFSSIEVAAAEPLFAEPLKAAARPLFSLGGEVVLLGSLAAGKYLDVLRPVLGERLLFPIDFAGRGDLSRGSIMLRAARSGVELGYQSAQPP